MNFRQKRAAAAALLFVFDDSKIKREKKEVLETGFQKGNWLQQYILLHQTDNKTIKIVHR